MMYVANFRGCGCSGPALIRTHLFADILEKPLSQIAIQANPLSDRYYKCPYAPHKLHEFPKMFLKFPRITFLKNAENISSKTSNPDALNT
jgi:hypothetical protein